MDFITVNTLMKYTVVTTFNADGYKTYGRRMIQTFLQTWPKDILLKVYAEGCQVTETAPNLQVLDLEAVSADLVTFKNKWRNVPKANGDIGPGSERKAFKWQAVRFAHKVYAIFHAAKHCTTDWLIWMDADMVCHSPISVQRIAEFFPDDRDLCYAGRSNKFTECGLYGMNLRREPVQKFLTEFQRMYDDAERGIFTLSEWHDSYVFDAVRKRFQLVELDWSSHLVTGEGHPFVNSTWGRYLDHLKCDRKSLGRSKQKDLKTVRTEEYWQTF
jgi:hypothetical protein